VSPRLTSSAPPSTAPPPATQALDLRVESTVPQDFSADLLTSIALLNCLLREVAPPWSDTGGWARIGLPVTGRVLRAALRRPSLAEPRLTGQVEQWDDAEGWLPLSWDRLAQLVDTELAGPAGISSPELIAEVTASHRFIGETLDRRATSPGSSPGSGLPAVGSSIADYLDSEQSLIAGHRFHPAPKARSGPTAEALAYAPEVGAEFRLRYLGVPVDLVEQHEAEPGAAAVFDAVPNAPTGHHLLPVHPWQYLILLRTKAFTTALTEGRLIDLGELGEPVRPTSSVRTVARPGATGFLKLSLAVQITNCLRINPPHELQAAVTVSRTLEPLRAELTDLFPGTVLLAEPAARTVRLGSADPDDELAAGLGVIAREGLPGRLLPGVRPILAAALIEPVPTPAITALFARLGADRSALIDWWDDYLARLLPPVLHAFLARGVVFEAHLQNVLIGLAGPNGQSGPNGRPAQLVLRDLEGVKLVGPRHAELLSELPQRVRRHLGYTHPRGWDRVAYCLFHNNLSGVLARLADLDPAAESRLWSRVRSSVQTFRREHGDAAQLRDLLAGLPLPAKTNLLTRWHRDADRDTGYLPVALPLSPAALPPGAR
jgi:siderophore synthetase component